MIANLSGSFTRPADTTAYTSGDLVANSTTAGSVSAVELRGLGHAPAGSAIVRRVGIRKSGTGTTNASFRVHFFLTGSITAANGDNAAFSVNNAADYLGYADVTVSQAFVDGAVGFGAPAIGSEFMVRLEPGSQSIYALVEAQGAYTPASAETITILVDMINEVV